MAQVKHTGRTAKQPAATKARSFRTFLLMAQFEAQEIGARIQQARNEKGVTQEELAEMASFSKRSLQEYEAGRTIPYRQLRELGKLLDRPTEWFLYGEPEATSQGADEIAERLEALEAGQERTEGALAEQRALLGELLRRLPGQSTAGESRSA